jgi:uncharacterized DUF497 family protein
MDLPRVGWDEPKARANIRKHGIDFYEAIEVLRDPLAVTMADRTTADLGEERFNIVGSTRSGRLLHVPVTHRGPIIRIISARRATARERHAYEEG